MRNFRHYADVGNFFNDILINAKYKEKKDDLPEMFKRSPRQYNVLHVLWGKITETEILSRVWQRIYFSNGILPSMRYQVF